MSYLNIEDFKPDDVHVYVKSNGTKDRIMVTYGPALRSLAFVTPPSKTNYPRVTGDGDYREGSQYGPQSKDKARFTIDLNVPVDGEDASVSNFFNNVITAVDDAVLDFMYHNQLKFLGRKNLTKEEVKMLQIRSVKQNLDKDTGELGAPFINLTCRKFYYDQVGNLR